MRRIAGNRFQLVGRAPRGLLELGQLAVHAVNARRRHASRHQQQPRRERHSSSRDGRAERRARRSRRSRCASSRPRARRASGRMREATDPPGSADDEFLAPGDAPPRPASRTRSRTCAEARDRSSTTTARVVMPIRRRRGSSPRRARAAALVHEERVRRARAPGRRSPTPLRRHPGARTAWGRLPSRRR